MSWIQTYTQKAFYPLDPKIDDIVIEDIARALSMQCRYAGHVNRFYSVAEHCCLLYDVLTEYKFEGLMHDASEAYLVDIPGPIKPMITNYVEIEDNLMNKISQKFHFIYPLPELVKVMDKRMLVNEMEQNIPGKPSPAYWGLDVTAIPNVRLQFWNPAEAEAAFMDRYIHAMLLRT